MKSACTPENRFIHVRQLIHVLQKVIMTGLTPIFASSSSGRNTEAVDPEFLLERAVQYRIIRSYKIDFIVSYPLSLYGRYVERKMAI